MPFPFITIPNIFNTMMNEIDLMRTSLAHFAFSSSFQRRIQLFKFWQLSLARFLFLKSTYKPFWSLFWCFVLYTCVWPLSGHRMWQQVNSKNKSSRLLIPLLYGNARWMFTKTCLVQLEAPSWVLYMFRLLMARRTRRPASANQPILEWGNDRTTGRGHLLIQLIYNKKTWMDFIVTFCLHLNIPFC